MKDCEPDVHFDFNDNTKISDLSGKGVIVGNKNTILNGQSATFSGNSMLNIWRFANMNFQTKLSMELQFSVSGFSTASEALVSNCIGSDVEEASILIKAERSTSTVLFRTETYQGTAEFSIAYNVVEDCLGFKNKNILPSLLNTVMYIYDGKRLTGIVNNSIKQAILTGDIQTRQTGIVLGAASKCASFQGQIDEFKLYKCFPGSVGQYITP